MEPLTADINSDGVVDAFDLSLLLAAWGTADEPADLNDDGTVDAFDLSLLLFHWGETAPTTWDEEVRALEHAHYGPEDDYVPPAGANVVSVGINPDGTTELTQSLIDSSPSNAIFVLEPGIHRHISPLQNTEIIENQFEDNERTVMRHFVRALSFKSGQQFHGKPGSELVGSKILEPGDFVKDGSANRWYITGQVQRLRRGETPTWAGPTEQAGLPGNELAAHGERVWITDSNGTDRWLKQVGSRAEVDEDSFFFGYGEAGVSPKDENNDPLFPEMENPAYANRIYIGVDPTQPGVVVETALSNGALMNNGAQLYMRNMTIRKHGNGAQFVAVQGGDGSLVEYCSISDNGALGIALNGNSTARYCQINRNGQGGGSSILNITHNEIGHNNIARFNPTWWGQGWKIAHSTGAAYQYNYVHDNYGTGLTFDINNEETSCEGNLIVNNEGVGFVNEISFSCEVFHNIIEGNGHGDWTYYWGMRQGIVIYNSSDTWVHHNIVQDNIGSGITLAMGVRPGYELTNVVVEDNIIGVRSGAEQHILAGVDVHPSVADRQDIYSPRIDYSNGTMGNIFRRNVYTAPNNPTTGAWFIHPHPSTTDHVYGTWANHQSLGHDLEGSIS